jgi:hypothetical protein
LTKKAEQYLLRIEALEKEFKTFVQNEVKARKELELHFLQLIASQREEIMCLQKELKRERQDRRKRTARASAKFRSE